jgi:inositol hexakisphosphate/diphosphoinositol-pentakisphosphate kinase
MLRACSELDYLTHLVFRLYENMAVPADHPERFRIEILFCPGTAFDPTEVSVCTLWQCLHEG